MFRALIRVNGKPVMIVESADGSGEHHLRVDGAYWGRFTSAEVAAGAACLVLGSVLITEISEPEYGHLVQTV